VFAQLSILLVKQQHRRRARRTSSSHIVHRISNHHNVFRIRQPPHLRYVQNPRWRWFWRLKFARKNWIEQRLRQVRGEEVVDLLAASATFCIPHPDPTQESPPWWGLWPNQAK
jgi:hypothetical protein